MTRAAPVIKTAKQIGKICKAGRLAAKILDIVGARIEPSVTTGMIDDWCAEIISSAGAVSAALNYCPLGCTPFPKSVCTSVNHQVCHGVPSHHKMLVDGDIVNLDVTVILDGHFGDTSRMFTVGKPSADAKFICETSRECMHRGIAAVMSGQPLNNIGGAIQSLADSKGFSVVQEYCGHGVGLSFHEPPQVLHYRNDLASPEMRPGMVFTVEPMINAGRRHVKTLADGWTVVTKDHSLSAQWEHTVMVGKDGAEILTLAD